MPPPAAAPRTTTRSMIRLLELPDLKTQTELQNAARRTPAPDTVPLSGTCQTRKSTCVRDEMRYRLLAGGTHIHVDFHADRYFDDFRRLPSHLALPLIPDEFRPCRLRYCGSKSSPVKSFAWNHLCLCCAARDFTELCEGRGQNSVKTTWDQAFRGCSHSCE
jgi:hypothetical protein